MQKRYPFITKLFIILITSASLTNLSYSQEKNIPEQHKEKIEDAKAKLSKDDQTTSPAFTYRDDMIFVSQVNVNENGVNIRNDAANEPSIAFDVNNPNNMAIGWRQFDNISSNFRQAGYAYTTDGGMTWTFPGVIDPGVFRSDPVLDSDSDGNFYYNSLTSDNTGFWCNVYKSTDGGATWDNGTYAYGGDKQWMVIDKVSEIGRGNIYAYWTSYYSICAPNSFTRSVDGGQSFKECTYIPNEPYWGTLAVAKNGDLYIGGFDGENYVVVKSTSAKYADSVVTFKDPVTVDLGGPLAGFGGPNAGGITGQTYIAVDTSDGIYSGAVYLLGTVMKNYGDGTIDHADLMIAASNDGGITWLPPVKISDDKLSLAWQWFGTLSVAPNGRLDVIWLDTRNAPEGTYFSELYYSFSYDGGQTWYPNVKLIDESFDPHVGWPNQNKMGDYFDMVSDNEGVHLAWAATYNRGQDVFYARIFTDVINSVEDKNNNLPSEFVLEQNYPNPFNPSTTIKFTIPRVETTRRVVSTKLIVYDILGREVQTLLNKSMQPGTYEVNFNASGLANGVYFYTLRIDNLSANTWQAFVQTKKMILMK